MLILLLLIGLKIPYLPLLGTKKGLPFQSNLKISLSNTENNLSPKTESHLLPLNSALKIIF